MNKTLGAVGVVILWLTVSATGASASCGSKDALNPGETFCLASQTFGSSASASGTSDKNVRFTVTDFTGGVLSTIFDQVGTSFSQTWDLSTNPELFAGTFTVCAYRGTQHSTSASVTLCLSGS